MSETCLDTREVKDLHRIQDGKPCDCQRQIRLLEPFLSSLWLQRLALVHIRCGISSHAFYHIFQIKWI